MKLRYGVIGAGVVAPLHLEAIAAVDETQLVGISALNREAAAALAQGAGTEAFADSASCSRCGRTWSSSAHRTRPIRH
jgi:predicted dehydrogenase